MNDIVRGLKMRLLSDARRLDPKALLAAIDEMFEILNLDLVEAKDAERSNDLSPDVQKNIERLAAIPETFPEFQAALPQIVGLVTTDNRQLTAALTIARNKLKTFVTLT